MFDEKTIDRARNADLISFFEKRYGFTFTNKGGVYRCSQHPSLAVKADRCSWYWHSKGVGGASTLDFLIIAECMPFREAVKTLTGVASVIALPQREAEQPKTLTLPEKAWLPLRLYDYLCIKRGISRNIVDKLIQEGKIYEDKRGNVVFVGFDEDNKPRFASIRGTYTGNDFRMDCAGSDKRYGFNMTYSESKSLYIYESALDAMSHATLSCIDECNMGAWKRQNRLSLAGTSDIALLKYIETRPYITELVFCLDNDESGQRASETFKRKYMDKGYSAVSLLPAGKDFSEDLQIMVRQIQAEKAQIRKTRGDTGR